MIARDSSTRLCIDSPVGDETVSASGFTVSGWAYRIGGAPPLEAVWATVDGVVVGETRLPFARPDVAGAFGFSAGLPCGFAFRVAGLPPGRSFELALGAAFGDAMETLGTIGVRTSAFDATKENCGTLADPSFDVVIRREHMYGYGPPSPVADALCVAKVLSYAEAGAWVLDVGCGIGAYAEPLLEAGRSWHGCEIVPEFVEAVRGRGLDVTQVSGASLPFDDASFDLAICVEVLEHIDAYGDFASEIARVARRGALFSVPNCGTIPRYAPLGIVPWHMLESTHLNFFTASSLKGLLERWFATVEVTEYGRLPVDAADGTPMFNHLFAVAMHARDAG